MQGGVAGTQGIIYTGHRAVRHPDGLLHGIRQGELPARGAEGELLREPGRTPKRRTCCSPTRLTRQPLQLNFSTQTYDFEAGDVRTARQTPGLQLRRQRPAQQLRHHHRADAENRTELGAFVQDEIIFDRRAVHHRRAASTSSATSTTPSSRRGWRRSSSRSTTTPSASRSTARSARRRSINNYLDISIVVPIDLSALAPLCRRPAAVVARRFRWSSARSAASCRSAQAAGRSEGGIADGVRGRLHRHVRVDGRRSGAAFYVNDLDDNINFTQLPN